MKITNNLGLPKQIVNACLDDDGHQPVKDTYHVTELIKPCKISVLERRHYDEIELDVNDCVWLIFGKAVHEVLQYGNISNFIKAEESIERKFDDVTIVGRMDLYNPRWKKVIDWKTATVTKVLKNDYEDYRRQGLEYAWILQGLGKTVGELEFHMFLKDWSKGQKRLAELQNRPYPNSAIQTWRYTVKPEDLEEIEAWIKERLETIRSYEKMTDDEIPDCSPEERWASPTTYAVMKEGRKSAVKLCQTLEEAEEMCKDDNKLRVEKREGGSRRCENYCLVAQWCRRAERIK